MFRRRAQRSVNSALADREVRERRLQALAVAIVAYEESHGEITKEEMAAQARRDREQLR